MKTLFMVKLGGYLVMRSKQNKRKHTTFGRCLSIILMTTLQSPLNPKAAPRRCGCRTQRKIRRL